MSYPHRCSRCRGRVSLKRPIGRYVRRPVCPGCGHDRLYLDRHRMIRERKKLPFKQGRARDRTERVCGCDGWWFPHRAGSLRCEHYDGPRDLEMEQFNAELGAFTVPPGDGDDPPF